MAVESKVSLTIIISSSDLDTEQQEKEAQSLFEQMKAWDEIERVSRIPDPSPPEESKALGSFLVGILTAEVKPENIKALLRTLSDRLLNKVIEIEVEANGRKLKVKANSQEELAAAIQEAQKFISL